MSILSKSGNYHSPVSPAIRSFFHDLEISRLLKKCNFHKEKGVPVLYVFQTLFQLVFSGMNLYRTIETGSTSLKKDTAYRFLNSSRYNWRRFLLLLSSSAIKNFIAPLTSKNRAKVLIVDDSYYGRSRSKKVELLAKVFDHVTGKYVKGFRMLTLGWSDGATFIPLSFSLLSSAKKENRIQEIEDSVDKRCNGYKRRTEALCKSTDMVVKLLQEALKQKIPASYVLFDSWFAFPALIGKVLNLNMNAICMVKRMHRVFYRYGDRYLNLEKLFSIAKKRADSKDILASICVDLNTKERPQSRVKIVFVRKKGCKNTQWLGILSTDPDLSDEEIVRIYGIRWDIEVFFKTAKSMLCLAREFQGRSYDLLVAHTSIVFTRYIMLSLHARQNKDDRSCGELFFLCCQEIKNVNFMTSLTLIISVLQQAVRNVLVITEEKLNEILVLFRSLLPEPLQRLYSLNNCES
jgi:hypothetical protein